MDPGIIATIIILSIYTISVVYVFVKATKSLKKT